MCGDSSREQAILFKDTPGIRILVEFRSNGKSCVPLCAAGVPDLLAARPFTRLTVGPQEAANFAGFVEAL